MNKETALKEVKDAMKKQSEKIEKEEALIDLAYQVFQGLQEDNPRFHSFKIKERKDQSMNTKKALKEIQHSLKNQNQKTKKYEELIITAYQVFKEIQNANSHFQASRLKDGDIVKLTYKTTSKVLVVCVAGYLRNLNFVYVGNGNISSNFYSSHLICSDANEVLAKIKDYVVLFCKKEGIKEL